MPFASTIILLEVKSAKDLTKSSLKMGAEKIWGKKISEKLSHSTHHSSGIVGRPPTPPILRVRFVRFFKNLTVISFLLAAIFFISTATAAESTQDVKEKTRRGWRRAASDVL